MYVCSFGNETKKSRARTRRREARPIHEYRNRQKSNNRNKKKKRNRTKLLVLTDFPYFSEKENFAKFLQTLVTERAHPRATRTVLHFLSRLAIPLINETLYASFITFVVPLWIRPKSFESAPRPSARPAERLNTNSGPVGRGPKVRNVMLKQHGPKTLI